MSKATPSGELLRRIAKLSSEAEWSAAETRDALSEAGVRAQDVTETIVHLVIRLKKESPFHWRVTAGAMRRELLERMQSRVRAETRDLRRNQLLDKVKEAMSRLPHAAADQYAVAFRNFEEATDDDLRSMLEELAILAELEEDQH